MDTAKLARRKKHISATDNLQRCHRFPANPVYISGRSACRRHAVGPHKRIHANAANAPCATIDRPHNVICSLLSLRWRSGRTARRGDRQESGVGELFVSRRETSRQPYCHACRCCGEAAGLPLNVSGRVTVRPPVPVSAAYAPQHRAPNPGQADRPHCTGSTRVQRIGHDTRNKTLTTFCSYITTYRRW